MQVRVSWQSPRRALGVALLVGLAISRYCRHICLGSPLSVVSHPPRGPTSYPSDRTVGAANECSTGIIPPDATSRLHFPHSFTATPGYATSPKGGVITTSGGAIASNAAQGDNTVTAPLCCLFVRQFCIALNLGGTTCPKGGALGGVTWQPVTSCTSALGMRAAATMVIIECRPLTTRAAHFLPLSIPCNSDGALGSGAAPSFGLRNPALRSPELPGAKTRRLIGFHREIKL